MRLAIRKEIAATMALAGPIAAAELLQMSMSFVDVIMVSRLGIMELAACALGNAVYFFILSVCTGVLAAVSPMVSQAYGRGQLEAIGLSIQHGLWLAVALALPAILVLQNFEPLLLAAGQDPEVVMLTGTYLFAISWALLPAFCLAVLRFYIEGVCRPRAVTVVSIFGFALNIVGNYVLMYGKLGLPALGLAGTGWATTLAVSAMFVALAAYTQTTTALRKYWRFEKIRMPDMKHLRELLHVGWPIGVMLGLEVGLFGLSSILIGYFGTTQLASHQIAIQTAAIAYMLPLGIAIATSVRVGNEMGANHPVAAQLAGYVGIALSATVMTMVAIAFWIWPKFFVGLYLDLDDPANTKVIEFAKVFLGIAAVFQIVDGIQVTCAGALRGLKDTRMPMLIAFLSFWIAGGSVGLFLSFVQQMEGTGIWWGLVIGLVIASFMLGLRFRFLLADGGKKIPVSSLKMNE